jgi:hypothetical protein
LGGPRFQTRAAFVQSGVCRTARGAAFVVQGAGADQLAVAVGEQRFKAAWTAHGLLRPAEAAGASSGSAETDSDMPLSVCIWSSQRESGHREGRAAAVRRVSRRLRAAFPHLAGASRNAASMAAGWLTGWRSGRAAMTVHGGSAFPQPDTRPGGWRKPADTSLRSCATSGTESASGAGAWSGSSTSSRGASTPAACAPIPVVSSTLPMRSRSNISCIWAARVAGDRAHSRLPGRPCTATMPPCPGSTRFRCG